MLKIFLKYVQQTQIKTIECKQYFHCLPLTFGGFYLWSHIDHKAINLRQTYFWSHFYFKQRNQHNQCEKWDQKSHSPRVSLSQVLWHWSYICSSQMYFWQLMILMMTHLLVMPAGWPCLYPWMTPYLQYWIQTLSQGHGFSRSLSPSHNVSQDSSFQNSLPPDFEFLLPLRHQILSVFCQKEHWRGWFTLGQHSDFFNSHLPTCLTVENCDFQTCQLFLVLIRLIA